MMLLAWKQMHGPKAIDQWWGRLALGSFQAGIAGGTDEIQKNIIGDRVLGLPRAKRR